MPISGGAQFLKPEDIFAKLDIKEGMTVADFGCGNLGYFVVPMAKLVGKEGRVLAIDIQKPVLQGVVSRAKLEGLTNLLPIWADLEKVGSTNIVDDSVDLILLINILFQNKKPQQILEEAKRILKNGGQLVIVDWRKTGIPFGPPLESRLDAKLVKTWANELGLSLKEETEFGDYFWGLIYYKV